MATAFEGPCGEEMCFSIDSVKKREEKGGDSQPASKECPHDLLTSHKALPLNGSAISPVVCKHDTISDLSYLRKLIIALNMVCSVENSMGRECVLAELSQKH